MKQVTALGLFSGGLDSLLACRIISSQSIRVIALKFITPFFDYHLKENEIGYRETIREKYGLEVRVVDIGSGYLDLLKNPQHGYGKHFNPCVDCKIFMLRRAAQLLPEYNASFLFTGEVLGQRPMSQRRDTLRVIERDSGCEDILLRPLCARRLPETKPEREGLVQRDKLYGLCGRGRGGQIELAAEFGITEYPPPAGGCILTDPNLGARIEKFYTGRFHDGHRRFRVNDIRLLLVGRQFLLPQGIWLTMGRNQDENDRISRLAEKGDWILKMVERPGPTALLRKAADKLAGGSPQETETLRLAAGLVARYARKTGGRALPGEISIEGRGALHTVRAEPLQEELFAGWKI
ncbi:MAG: thiamine biosynthesis protein [Desulfobulbaceae bacterium]|nr:thiamine biosynthesis protein [Desulfobulbaceae bacterium]